MKLALPSRKLIAPQQGASIAPKYRNGLKVLWSGAMGAGYQNLAPSGSGGIPYGGGSLFPIDAKIGRSLNFGTSDNAMQFSVTSDVTTLTLLVCVQFHTIEATAGFFQWEILNNTTTSGNPRILLQNNSGDLRYYDGSGYVITETGAGPAGSIHSIVLRSTPSETVYYRNGKATATSAPGTNTGNALYFGSGFSNAASCYQPLGAWWEADIGHDAAMELSVNPWVVFAQEQTAPILNLIAAAATTTLMGQACL